MKAPYLIIALAIVAMPLSTVCIGQEALSSEQLQQLLVRFPAADANGDGINDAINAAEVLKGNN